MSVVERLLELIELKDIKINGMEYAIDLLKNKQKKAVRELQYLRSQYDSKVEREALENAINVIKKIYE